ncbi:MAG: D-alanyl-D-alanine carboxypeptidase family protein [Lachnospiraceae bacterium]
MHKLISILSVLSLTTYLMNPFILPEQVQNPVGLYDVDPEVTQEAEEISATIPQTPESTSQEGNNTEPEHQVPEDVVNYPDLGLTAVSTILMEASTGTIIYADNPDARLSPASITKIMTLILIFDALDAGKIQLTDEVTTSAYAKSMGGSQVFLEEGEKQSVETLIKCIIVASGNDASVAMAEYISGSETEFVNQMNLRAKDLGMNNTNFEDCCGLTESDNHYTSARDVAIMSRELVTKYPQVHNYSTIWMENITHVTDKGSSEFGLANTNKLLKQYQWANGLKTGSTSKAKYCVSATALKDGVELIAVVMAAPDYKVRFAEAAAMFNYGYANCKLYKDESPMHLDPAVVKDGVADEVRTEYGKEFSYLSTTGEDFSTIEKEIVWNPEIIAPIVKGDKIGEVQYKLNGKMIGSLDILAAEDVEKAGFFDYLKKALDQMLL